MTAINTDFEEQLRSILMGWPPQFVLEQQALFLNLTNLQTTFLLHKYRKKGGEGPEVAKRMLQNWMVGSGRRNPSHMTSLSPRPYSDELWQELQQLDLVPDHWKDIDSLRGGMQGAEVRKRLG